MGLSRLTPGKILLINRVAESLVGMDTSEAVGRQLEEVYLLRQDQESQVGEKGCILTGKGGSKYAIEEVRTTLTEMESDESGVVIVFRDITERKRTKEALQRAHDELEQRVADRTEELMRVNEELQTEITERNQAELALRDGEEKYRTIINSIEEAYFELDLPGNLLFFNNPLVRIMGYTSKELQGLNFREYMSKEDAKKYLPVLTICILPVNLSKISPIRSLKKTARLCMLRLLLILSGILMETRSDSAEYSET